MPLIPCAVSLFLAVALSIMPAAAPRALGRAAPPTHTGTVTDTTAPGPLVFDQVTVVNVEEGRLLSGQRVVVVGRRIQRVGSVQTVPLPPGAQVVDAKGKYLVPGFWDMHAHVDGQAEQLYPKFIAHGVTGVREMAQRFPRGTVYFRRWQREVMAGQRIGPRVVGPSADFIQPNFEIRTPEDARRVIDSLHAAGMVFLKYHPVRRGDRALYFALLREARRVGLPFVGHVPLSVTNVEAADSGQASIEHLEENHQCWPNFPGFGPRAHWQMLGDSATAEARCAPVVEAYLRNNTWLTLTLTCYWVYDGQSDELTGLWEDQKRLVRLLHRLGIRNFLVGSDWAPNYSAWELDRRFQPGLSAVEELVAYVEAGLSPLEALQAATLNPARFFHATDSLGTVAPGKLADLVLLAGNPLTDIRNVLQLKAVVANGRYFDRAALDTLDPEGLRLGGRLAAHEHPDTAQVLLTIEALTRMTTFWNAFSQEPPAIRDTASQYYRGRLTLILGKRVSFRTVDMDALAALYPSVAAAFERAGLTSRQWMQLRRSLYTAELQTQMTGSAQPYREPGSGADPSAVVWQNVEFVRTHRKELDALVATGMWFPTLQDAIAIVD